MSPVGGFGVFGGFSYQNTVSVLTPDLLTVDFATFYKACKGSW